MAHGFGRQTRIAGLDMMNLRTIAAGIAIAGSLGFAALGIGTSVANAAPSPVGSGAEWALDSGWGHGDPGWNDGGHDGGRGGGDWNRGGGWNGGGPNWGPPPPPPNYGYGGYGGGGCVTGPFGLLQFCP
jgi:hypothetical protein